jgi:uncharacterized membrane protein
MTWLRNFWHALKGYDNVAEGPDTDVKLDIESSHKRAPTGLAIIGLSLLGMIISIYMIYEFYHPLGKAFCDVSEGVSCTKLVLLGWASLFGVPISVLGLVWFITLFIAQLLALQRHGSSLYLFVLLWALGGALFIVYLVSVEVFIGTICLMCTVVHIILLIVLSLATFQFWRHNGHPEAKSLPSLALQQVPSLLRKHYPFLLVAIVLNILPLAAFNTVPALQGVGDGWTAGMKTSLAHCLHKKHITAYTKAGCPYCAWQKSLFGNAVSLLDLHVCTDPNETAHCTAINIIGYPTWVMYTSKGKEITRHLGELGMDDLDDWSGCHIHQPVKPTSKAPISQ